MLFEYTTVGKHIVIAHFASSSIMVRAVLPIRAAYQPGLVHLLEHCLVDGFSQRFNDLGIDCGASTSKEAMTVTFQTSRENCLSAVYGFFDQSFDDTDVARSMPLVLAEKELRNNSAEMQYLLGSKVDLAGFASDDLNHCLHQLTSNIRYYIYTEDPALLLTTGAYPYDQKSSGADDSAHGIPHTKELRSYLIGLLEAAEPEPWRLSDPHHAERSRLRFERLRLELLNFKMFEQCLTKFVEFNVSAQEVDALLMGLLQC